MNNASDEGNLYLYQKLAASSVLTTGYTVDDHQVPAFFIYPEWPRQGANYPLCFIDHAVPRSIVTVGTDRIDDNSIWNLHIVGSRDMTYSDLKPAVDEILKSGFLHHTIGSTPNGLISGASLEGAQHRVAYQVGADWYPRVIIPFRVFASGA